MDGTTTYELSVSLLDATTDPDQALTVRQSGTLTPDVADRSAAPRRSGRADLVLGEDGSIGSL
ncbi:MAG TPA: hypothetical protein VGX28_14085 [Frankiaceae bacterium]|jgi:hypothetical protein|nr:hypothetical protein [Frankiaceae bacterium]